MLCFADAEFARISLFHQPILGGIAETGAGPPPFHLGGTSASGVGQVRPLHVNRGAARVDMATWG